MEEECNNKVLHKVLHIYVYIYTYTHTLRAQNWRWKESIPNGFLCRILWSKHAGCCETWEKVKNTNNKRLFFGFLTSQMFRSQYPALKTIWCLFLEITTDKMGTILCGILWSGTCIDQFECLLCTCYFVNIPLICSRINNPIVVARKECCVYMWADVSGIERTRETWCYFLFTFKVHRSCHPCWEACWGDGGDIWYFSGTNHTPNVWKRWQRTHGQIW